MSQFMYKSFSSKTTGGCSAEKREGLPCFRALCSMSTIIRHARFWQERIYSDVRTESITHTACSHFALGKGENIWDRLLHTRGPEAETGDVACDSYHRYKEDVALIKDIGVSIYIIFCNDLIIRTYAPYIHVSR